MTVVGWILFALVALAIITMGGGLIINIDKKSTTICTCIIAVVLIIALFFGMRWYYSSTESGKRAMKSQESNFNAGIERRVEVYDMEGDLIKEYEGKFNVDYDNDRIIFDDENGKRHVIYYPTGTVIIDELGE